MKPGAEAPFPGSPSACAHWQRSPPSRRSACGRGRCSALRTGRTPSAAATDDAGPPVVMARLRHAGPVEQAPFRRDRLTWTAYVVLAWFAYLQAAPGLVIGHLRSELDLSYATGGLHVAAFAAGSMVAGLTSARFERALGRRTLFWSAAA